LKSNPLVSRSDRNSNETVTGVDSEAFARWHNLLGCMVQFGSVDRASWHTNCCLGCGRAVFARYTAVEVPSVGAYRFAAARAIPCYNKPASRDIVASLTEAAMN